jgi:gluconate 5-dehydrogenase
MKNMFDLTGKVAVVTGASSGLGVQYAKLLAENGADLAILARRENKLEQVKKEILAMGRKCEAYQCDVAKEEDVVNTFAKIEKDFGRIDILVNNAGVVYPGNDTADWDKVIDINLRAVFLTVREAMKGMVERNYGKIINISSVAGLNGMAYMPSYNASKGGVIVLTKSQAMDGAQHGVTVNCICPGVFESEMTEETFGGHVDDSNCGGTPMKRIGREGELNGAMLYFASDASSYTTGQALAVDGGWTSYVP